LLLPSEAVVFQPRTAKEPILKLQAFCLVFLALGGCVQLPATTATSSVKTVVPGEIMSFSIPPDTLGARDPQLTAVLNKAGRLAAAQPRPTTILVTALGQDFAYINQAIWKGVPAQHSAKLSLENQTAGANQAYSVLIKSTQ
jgi:hypothetical protein